MCRRSFVQTTILVAAMLLSASAIAQEKPYSPKAAEYSSLIQMPGFESVPVAWDFPEVETRTVVTGSRLDFQVIYDVPVDEFVKFHIEDQGERTVARVNERAFPNIASRDLFLFGKGNSPGGAKNFTLGSKKTPYRVSVSVEADPVDPSRTMVTVKNMLLSRTASAIVPARVGYLPSGANEIGFRYN